jgi:EpsI family protein
MNMRGSLRFTILLIAILMGGALANAWAYLGEAHVARKELKEFPTQLGSWQRSGSDQEIDRETMTVLRASDYLLRNYKSVDGRTANFYVGYYASQRNGASYHSPLNCLPGAGWVLNNASQITITPADGRAAFAANRYLIESGSDKSVLVYWYQGRGRREASEYWGKVYTVLDSIRLRRSDAAMVRIVVDVGASEEAALKTASDFAANASVLLPQYVPD